MTCSYTFGYFCPWNYLAFVSATVPVIFFVLMIFMPESPRYLLTKYGRMRAAKSLMWLRGAQGFDYINTELNQVQIEEDHIFCIFVIAWQCIFDADSKEHSGNTHPIIFENVSGCHSKTNWDKLGTHVLSTMEWDCMFIFHRCFIALAYKMFHSWFQWFVFSERCCILHCGYFSRFWLRFRSQHCNDYRRRHPNRSFNCLVCLYGQSWEKSSFDDFWNIDDRVTRSSWIFLSFKRTRCSHSRVNWMATFVMSRCFHCCFLTGIWSDCVAACRLAVFY